MSLTFNSVSSDTLGLVVERYPSYVMPARKMSAYEVAGRNGDILLQQDAFMNVVQAYECYINGTSGLTASIQGIISWLIGTKGYLRLEDSYNPNQYRLAYCNNSAEIVNSLNKYGRCTIEFSCKPQRYLTSGESAVSVTSGDTLTNPTVYYSRPLITVSGSGAITFNGLTINVLETVSSFNIDCQTMNADDNTKIYCLDFPYFIGGENEITLGEGITSCSIVPRWWTL